MKYRLSFAVLVLAFFLAACGKDLNQTSYQAVLPDLPSHWLEVLGEPHWRLEWLEEGGIWQKWEGAVGSEAPGIPFISEWTTPVLAFPFWPERNLLPGVMRPAGGLFPWDAAGGRIKLSWKGGVDAFFWKELAIAERATPAAAGRIPWHFAWPRFRELLTDGNISETVRLDPWLADWRSISQRVVQSGFDRRRIVERPFTEIAIPDIEGVWVGSSPFAEPLKTEPGEPFTVNAPDVPDTWVSNEAILKCSADGWVIINN